MLVHMVDLANWYFGPIKQIHPISIKLHQSERTIQQEIDEADQLLEIEQAKEKEKKSWKNIFKKPD